MFQRYVLGTWIAIETQYTTAAEQKEIKIAKIVGRQQTCRTSSINKPYYGKLLN